MTSITGMAYVTINNTKCLIKVGTNRQDWPKLDSTLGYRIICCTGSCTCINAVYLNGCCVNILFYISRRHSYMVNMHDIITTNIQHNCIAKTTVTVIFKIWQ